MIALGALTLAGALAAPPAKTKTSGPTSSIWRSTKGRQAAVSAGVGVRLPGGRQNKRLVI